MRIALAQLNFHIGNFEDNFLKISKAIDTAHGKKADLIVFSEMAICGYPPHDLLERKEFIDKCYLWLQKVVDLADDIAIVIGCPGINPNEEGKMLFNSAYFIEHKKIVSIHHKSLLPTYDVFDEYRYFEPNKEFLTISFKGKKVAVTICEDLWDDQPIQNAFGKSKLYPVSPMKELMKSPLDFVINIAASPYDSRKGIVKQSIFTGHAKKYGIPLFYVNQIGANTELIFDGGSMVVNSKGEIYDQLKIFQEDVRVYDLNDVINNKNPQPLQAIEEIQKIHDALVLGLKDYFFKSGFKKAVLGLSGGIDSAVVLCIAEKALGHENLRALLMPSKYSSDHSVRDAVQLAENLKIPYDILSIQPSFESINETMNPVFKGCKEDLTEENIQARIRGMLLMAVSNKHGHILLNTTNKSEMAVGYGTLYGDMSGGISVLGDVYKTEVYQLARFINLHKEVIPENIITKAPSAELRPDQKDSDSLPDYAVLDDILFHYIEKQESPEYIYALGYDHHTVEKIVRLVNSSEYKRFQAPPVLRVSSKAFGFSRKMPLVFKY